MIINDEFPIEITIKYPLLCDDWGTDLLVEYQRKIMSTLSLECTYYITWEADSLLFQEYDRQKPDEP